MTVFLHVAPVRRAADVRSAWGWLAASLAVVAAAAALRAVLSTDPDTSWLLYAAARTLAGAVPYRDILEVNPPASIFLYVPPVWVAGRLGLQPEAVTDAFVFAAAFVGLGLSASILVRSGTLRPREALRLAAPALALVLVLPLNSFAQREHVAVLALLPALACLAARLHGRGPRALPMVLAGIAAGVAVSIKPVFGLAFAGPLLLLLLRTRSPRRVAAAHEIWIAAALALAYAAAVRVFVPDFADRVLPLVMAVYLPARLPLLVLLMKPFVWIWLALLLGAIVLRPCGDAGLVPLLASAGLMAGVFIQGKGFSYHAYPAIALAALACADILLRAAEDLRPRTLVAAGVAGLAVLGAADMFLVRGSIDGYAPGLRPAVAAISPHPRTLTIGPNMPLGRVLARQLGGEWVGSMPLAWITLFASFVVPDPEHDPRFAAAIAMERDVYGHDIAREHPDVVLVEGESWLRWAGRGPVLAQALTGYAETGRYGDLILLRRVPDASAQAAPAPALPATDAPL